MEISQIVGAAKDPVAHVEEDKQLKGVGAVNAVQPVKKDEGAGQPPSQEQTPPSFTHLRHDPLQLLLRAVTAHLTELSGINVTQRPALLGPETELTPASTAARIVALFAATFERYRVAHAENDTPDLIENFRLHTETALHNGVQEAREVLGNLGLLDGVLEQRLDSTIEVVRRTFARVMSLE